MDLGKITGIIFLDIFFFILIGVADAFFYRKKPLNGKAKAVIGLITGAAGVLMILTRANTANGDLPDAAPVMIGVTAAIFGFMPSGITALLTVGFWTLTVKKYVLAYAAANAAAVVLGLLLRKLKTEKPAHNGDPLRSWQEYLVLGYTVCSAVLAMLLTVKNEFFLEASCMLLFAVFPLMAMAFGVIINANPIAVIGREAVAEKKTAAEMTETMTEPPEKAPIGIAFGERGSIKSVNGEYEKITGYSEEESIKLGWRHYTHPDDIERESELFNALESGKISSVGMEKRYVRPDGRIIWAYIMLVSLEAYTAVPASFICFVTEISELKKAGNDICEKNILAYYQNCCKRQTILSNLLNSVPDHIFCKNSEGRYIGCNLAFERFTGRKAGEIIGKTDYEIFGKSEAEHNRQRDLQVAQSKTKFIYEETMTGRDGRETVIETLETPLYGEGDLVVGVIGVSRDITERREREARIRYLNYHDMLTGLYNRAFFEDKLKELDSPEFYPLTVIIGDINGLKLINDAFGHEQGDKMIRRAAEVIKSCVGDRGYVARVGGDEFSVAMPKTGDDAAHALIKQIAAEYGKTELNIGYSSISLGYAVKTGNESMRSLLRLAEGYMYKKKLLEQKSLHSAIISSIKTTMFEKSHETEAHAERLAALCVRLGEAMKLGEEKLNELELFAMLHDIGKINVDGKILSKKSGLSDEEWEQMKKHPEIGSRITQALPELRYVSEYILCHHERWDGTGYPQGLKGEKIPLLSRILAIADAYDAMTNDRVYRKAMTPEEAVAEIAKNAGTQFDPNIVDIFVRLVAKN